jgi:hypothetical protein
MDLSIQGIIIGLLGVVLGGAFAIAGYRWFLILLPIWGLFVGFMFGAGATATLLGEGFLASVIGIGVGVVMALIFALLSWFYWWGAVAVIGGTLGYGVMHWLLEVIGFSADGWLIVLISLIAGVAVGIVALLINAPKYVAIILTAFAGAAWFTAGIALFFGLILPEDMPNGSLVAIYMAEGWLWILIWGVVAAVGIVAQLQMTKRWEQDIVAVYSTRNPM